MNDRAELLPASAMIDAPAPIVSESGQVLEIINRVAMDPNADIDKMERLLAMYQELQKSKAEREFNAALQTVQREMPRIKRDATNTHTDSQYARLETINATLIPIYTRNGFSLSFSTAKSDVPDCIKILCSMSHIGGHTRPYEYDSPITTTGIGGKTMMTKTHASGSALSYGRRYLTLLIFNAQLTNEDDDAQSAEEPVAREAQGKPTKIAPKKLRQIIDGMLEAEKKQDGPGLLEIWNELDNEEKEFVWGELRSWERSALKKSLEAAKARDCGVQLDKLSESTLREVAKKGDLNALADAMAKVTDAYAANQQEVPGDIQSLYQDLRAELRK